MAAMRNWIQRLDADEARREKEKRRVAVVHCKAGKGRSGTVACSYLISEEGWNREEALQRFTSRRMRVGFGQGVSIPSQLRYVGYVDRWTNSLGKKYIERPIEIVEIHVWALRDGVKVAVESYVEEGKRIKTFHTFTRDEKTVIDQGNITTMEAPISAKEIRKDSELITSPVDDSPSSSALSLSNNNTGSFQTVILRPSSSLVIPTSDVNIDFERRNKAGYTGFTVVTSIAHVWFNTYFEGGHKGDDSGVFEIEWDAMDGIKGSARKGTRALDRLKVVWKYVEKPDAEHVILEPQHGEPVHEPEAADWRGKDDQETAEAKHSDGVDSSRPGGAALTMGTMIEEGADSLSRELGLRKANPASADISRASSVKGETPPRKSIDVERAEQHDESEGVKAHLAGESKSERTHHGHDGADNEVEGRRDTKAGQYMEAGMAKVAGIVAKMKGEDNDRTDDQKDVSSHRK
jgi:protein-tyrosine phosphatase